VASAAGAADVIAFDASFTFTRPVERVTDEENDTENNHVAHRVPLYVRDWKVEVTIHPVRNSDRSGFGPVALSSSEATAMSDATSLFSGRSSATSMIADVMAMLVITRRCHSERDVVSRTSSVAN
jgi:hypothetical protein